MRLYRVWNVLGRLRLQHAASGMYVACAALLLATTGLAVDQIANTAVLAGDAALEANDILVSHQTAQIARIESPPAPATGPAFGPVFGNDRGIIVASASLALGATSAEPASITSNGPAVSSRPLRGTGQPLSKVEREDSHAWYSGFGETYQTMCVRLCDGAYWPVSFSTSAESFDHDESVCRSSCAAPTRLYHFSNPGGAPETMEDASGRAYSRLKAAFLFQSRRDSSCSCKAEPWSVEARAQHRVMALQAQLVSQRQPKSRNSLALTAPQVAALQKEIVGLQSTIGVANAKLAASRAQDLALDDGPALPRIRPRKQTMAGALLARGAGFMGLGVGSEPASFEKLPFQSTQPQVAALRRSSNDEGWQKRFYEGSSR